MGLINQDNRLKRDLANVRTPEDVMRRLADNVKITTDEVKGLTVEVSGKVGNDEIISRINQSAEAVTIDANKININGTISANGNFKVDTQGNMSCKGATAENITLKSFNSRSYTKASEGALMTFDSVEENFASVVDYNSYSSNVGLQEGDLKIFTPRAYMGADSGLSSLNPNNCWGYLFLTNASGETNIEATGKTGNIKCVSLTQTSKEEYKKNFEKLENALDIVKGTDIYKCNLKDEKETDKKHIGFVIGKNFNYREEITSKENDGVNIYSMVSVLWKAVQEQQKEIEELKKVIK